MTNRLMKRNCLKFRAYRLNHSTRKAGKITAGKYWGRSLNRNRTLTNRFNTMKKTPEKRTMKVICAWCNADLGQKPCLEHMAGSVSHGICADCSDKMLKRNIAKIHNYAATSAKVLCFALWLGAGSVFAGIEPACQTRIANAIYQVEGGTHTRFPYGIKSVQTHNPRQVCLNTIANNFNRWQRAGAHGDFLDYLANVYCPSSADKRGNENWKRNIHKLLKTKGNQ